MRVLSLARLLFTLLAFQLALGMQVGVAYASAMSAPPAPAHESSAANSSDDSCAMHNASSPGHDTSKPADKHECCKSSGCQGQCGDVPLAFNVSAIRGASATAVVQPIRARRVAIAPTDTHFRPPIAS